MKEMFRSVFDADYQGYGIFLDKVLKPLFGDKLEVLPVAEDNPTNVSDEAMERARIKKIVRVANIAATFDRDTMEVFDITLEDNVNIARARVGIQQLIRRGLFVHTHAFMIFHAEHPEGESWRFSYARKLGTVGSMTDAKRYTYLFGKNMHCRTAIDRFAVLAAGEITDQKLLDAFNVEALSDEFFEEYRKKYAAFVKYITGKEFVKENGKWVEKAGTPNEELMAQFRGDDKAVRDYVKKMMGRITFLHFLQKKGWMNGDVNYMQHLFDSSDQKANYLEAVLEPLFFGILNTKPQNRIKLFTERHWDLSLLDQWESFPYLNGGLFEEDEDDRLDVVFPENYFVGLFNFYSRFNFTVDENDPDDAEVGVDPEMLGKIFENLLEDNKDKGAFYTPKEIVRYMCQESLTAYLVGKTGLDEEIIRAFVVHPYDEVEKFTSQQQNQIYNALERVKICDPAIGSGAFPMGLLNELVRCEEALLGEREEEHQSRAGLKKYIIQNNIYGVDIEKGAIDIARLRFWLSIVVDEENPSPLPNLDYKIMQGNSLLESYKKVDLSHLLAEEGIGEEMQGGLFSDLDVIQDTREELAAYLEAYFNCSDHEEKLRIQQDIRTAINVQLSARNLNVDFGDLDIAANQEFFLWHTWFSDVFNRPSDCEKGFDIVIGNPPYVDSETMTRIMPLTRAEYASRFSTARGNWDMFIVFVEQGYRLLSVNGIYSFIVPNKIIAAKYASHLRELLARTRIKEVRDYSRVRVFEDAAVYPCTLMGRRAGTVYANDLSRFTTMSDKAIILRSALTASYFLQQFPFWDVFFNEEETVRRVLKMFSNTKLRDLENIEISGAATVSEAYAVKDVIFDSEKCDDSYKIINTGTIDPFHVLWGECAMQYIKGRYQYPRIKRDDLQQINETRLRQTDSCKIIVAGMSSRIEAVIDNGSIMAGKSTTIIVSNDINKLKVLLAVLNSDIVSWYMNILFNSLKMAGGYLNYGVREISTVPIPNFTDRNEEELIDCVNSLIGHPNDDNMSRKLKRLNDIVTSAFLQ